jgi:DNA-directed RNA polymerase specialized sigma24 family protein
MRGLEAHTTSEDVVAEVFARALAGGFFERFADRGRGSLERAMTSILERTLADGYRRLGAHRRGLSLALRAGGAPSRSRHEPDHIPATDATPTSSARAAELLDLCRKTLDEEEWEVWRATEILGLDSLAIAGHIGKSASAARSILHRARMKLLRVLADVPG